MTTTNIPDNSAQSWRDLADQVTPEQIDGFERMERRFTNEGIGDQPQAKASLLEFARDYAQRNLVDAAYADVPVPPGASTDSEGWGKDLKRGGWRRALLWRTYGEPREIKVDISGWQDSGGSFTRHVCLWGSTRVAS